MNDFTCAAFSYVKIYSTSNDFFKQSKSCTTNNFSIMDFILARNFAGRDHGTQMSGNSSENVAAVAAAAELRQMSSCQNPAYGRLSNFDIDRKVSEALIIRKHTAERGEH